MFCMRWQAAAKMPPTPSDAGGGFRPYDPSKGGRAASLQGDIKPNFRDMNGEVRGPLACAIAAYIKPPIDDMVTRQRIEGKAAACRGSGARCRPRQRGSRRRCPPQHPSQRRRAMRSMQWHQPRRGPCRRSRAGSWPGGSPPQGSPWTGSAWSPSGSACPCPAGSASTRCPTASAWSPSQVACPSFPRRRHLCGGRCPLRHATKLSHSLAS